MRMRTMLADESGVMLITFGLLVPVLLIFGVLAVDTGNWFVHQRHLQTQADAAALAAAGSYRFPTCDDTAIRRTALRYSGVGDGTTAYNDHHPTVDGGRLHAVINGPDYFNQSKPGDGDLAGSPAPCASGMVDVKMTETDLPYFFRSGVLDHLNARARVGLFKIASAKNTLPLAVQEAAPRKVRAFIVDEKTGTPVPGASVELTRSKAGGGLQPFDNETAPLHFTPPAGATDLGVRLALSGSGSTTCGDPLVACYEQGTTGGLSYIRAWTDANDPALKDPPVARGVRWTSTTCQPAFRSGAGACTANLEAAVKWNPAVTTIPGKTALKATYNGQTVAMAYSATTRTWTTTSPLTVAGGAIGATKASLSWTQQQGEVGKTDCTKGGGCTGTIADVQRTYFNQPAVQASKAGPVAALDVHNGLAGPQVNDLQACSATHPDCAVDLVFEVSIKGSLELAKPSDPPVSLRVSGNGSQNQTVDCDPGRTFVEEVAYGCNKVYQANSGTPCSAPTTPPSCVPVQTGTAANKPAQGLNMRVLCEPVPGNCKGSPGNYDGKPKACPGAAAAGHNNWPTPLDNDPRLLPVYEVPFGSFTGSGNQLVPVTGLATFYITGWTANGGGFDNPCQGNGDEFVPGTEGDNGAVSGHFVQHIYQDADPSPDACDLSSVNPCVAVLVK